MAQLLSLVLCLAAEQLRRQTPGIAGYCLTLLWLVGFCCGYTAAVWLAVGVWEYSGASAIAQAPSAQGFHISADGCPFSMTEQHLVHQQWLHLSILRGGEQLFFWREQDEAVQQRRRRQ
jgi:hypothetical protein